MRRVLVPLAVLAALAGVAVRGLVGGAFLAPTSSLFAVVGSMVWAPFGPFLLLAVLAAFGVGLAAWLAGRRRLGGAVLALCAPGIVGAGYILGRIGVATLATGGTLDLPASLLPGPMGVPPPDLVETVRTVEGVTLRAAIYRPPGAPPSAPMIVYIHGGGFMTGTFTETAADLRWFADRGWLVVSVEYRLFSPGHPTWEKAPDDVACALAWAARNAARLGGDPARLALLGDSAGGNLAINAAFAAAAGRLSSGCGAEIPVPVPVPVPVAVATLYPAVDPVSIYEEGFPIPGFAPRMLIEGYIGGSPDEHPQRVAAVASATHLTPLAPPTLIVLPENDALVVASGTLGFVQQAEAAGVPVTLVRVPFANHVFNQIAAGSLGNQIGRTVRLRFLEQHVP